MPIGAALSISEQKIHTFSIEIAALWRYHVPDEVIGMKNLMLIVNPNAGKGGYKTALGQVLHIFYTGGYLCRVFFTEGGGSARRLCREHAAEYDLVVCMGGDGTLSEVTAGLAETENAPEMGYIPMGTTNDMANSLGLGKDAAECAHTILTGRAMELDIGSFGRNDRFTYVAAFGAFTDVSYMTPQQNKQTLGHLAYLLEGMKSLPKLPLTHARVEHDGGVLEGDFILGGVSNSTSIAGLFKLDDSLVSFSDGQFELVLVRYPKSIADLQTALTEYMNRQYQGSQLTVLHSSRVKFTFDKPVAWTRDGENGGEHLSAELAVIPRAVRIRVSPERFA